MWHHSDHKNPHKFWIRPDEPDWLAMRQQLREKNAEAERKRFTKQRRRHMVAMFGEDEAQEAMDHEAYGRSVVTYDNEVMK